MLIKVLIVDDEVGSEVRDELNSFEDSDGTCMQSTVVTNADQAIDALQQDAFDVAVVDMVMPDSVVPDAEAGLRVIEAIRDSTWDTQTIVLTGHASNQNTVRAMEAGAFSYVDKSFEGWQILPIKVKLAAERKRWKKERLEAKRHEFVSKAVQDIAHDMGNSLQLVNGFVSFALELSQKTALELQDHLSCVHFGGEFLKGMHQDILWLGDQSHAKHEIAPFHLAKNLAERYPLFVAICSQRRCEFRAQIECDGEVSVCGSLLVRAIENLIANGARAVTERWSSGPGGFVALSVSDTADCLCIKVEDNGIGMSAELRARILQPGSYGDYVRENGIGLQAAKRTIEFHNGALDVESELNVGTTFTIRIPDHRPQ